MPDGTSGKEVLADLMAGTKKLISRLREDMDELSTKGKIKLEIMSLKNKRARAFRELGMRAYVLLRKKKYEIPEVSSLIGIVRRLESAIDAQEKALETLNEALKAKTTGGIKKPAATGKKSPGKIPAKRVGQAGP